MCTRYTGLTADLSSLAIVASPCMSVLVELVASSLAGSFTLSTVAFPRPLTNFGVTASGVLFF